MREKTKIIRAYLMEQLLADDKKALTNTAKHFQISQQAVNRHCHHLIKTGYINASGKTRGRSYKITKPFFSKSINLTITSNLSESDIWRQHLLSYAMLMPNNIKEICQYGFTEMLNNIIDHSQTTKALIKFEYIDDKIEFQLRDTGIGIFKKIYRELGLESERQAILELTKGKLTTDPKKHSGEGIFFTSRMFDLFILYSGNLFFSHKTPGDDWLIENKRSLKGTSVFLEINPNSQRQINEVFDKYAEDIDAGFSKTHVPVVLAEHEGVNLISRSQAKRLLMRFNRFEEVFLDFSRVDMIGQGFADEIFRVFRNANPQIKIIWINANEKVEKMIRHVQNSRNL